MCTVHTYVYTHSHPSHPHTDHCSVSSDSSDNSGEDSEGLSRLLDDIGEVDVDYLTARLVMEGPLRRKLTHRGSRIASVSQLSRKLLLCSKSKILYFYSIYFYFLLKKIFMINFHRINVFCVSSCTRLVLFVYLHLIKV